MIIKFDTDRLEHMKEMSCYNHNYYKLPYSINDCDVVFNHCEDDCNEEEWSIGNIIDGEFIARECFYSLGMDGEVDLLKNKIPHGGLT